jgi:hypothetical protein
VLGAMAPSDMEFLRKGQSKYISRPRFEKISVEMTLAKKHFSKFFQDEMEQTSR